jgi:hypothetical protein
VNIGQTERVPILIPPTASLTANHWLYSFIDLLIFGLFNDAISDSDYDVYIQSMIG